MTVDKWELAKMIAAILLFAGAMFFLFAMFTATPEKLDPDSPYEFRCVYVKDSYHVFDTTNGETLFFVGSDGRSHQIDVGTYYDNFDFWSMYHNFGGHVFKVSINETSPSRDGYTPNFKIYGVQHGIVDFGIEKVVTSYGCESEDDGRLY
jgi:hypothetical protein